MKSRLKKNGKLALFLGGTNPTSICVGPFETEIPGSKGETDGLPMTVKAPAVTVTLHESISETEFSRSVKVKFSCSPSTITAGSRKPWAPGVWVTVTVVVGLDVAVGVCVALALKVAEGVAVRVPVGEELAVAV